MLCHKSVLLTLATGFGLRLLAGAPDADAPAEASPPAPPALNAFVRDGEIVGWEQRRRVYMNVAGRRLMLAVPQDFRADITSPDKVVLANREYSCVLTFRIVAAGSVAASSLNADLCRAWLSTRLSDLKIQEEFSQAAASGSGPAFDLICKVDGVVRASRVAFIASPVGVLEFSSLSSPEKFEEAKATLRFALRSFQISDANGQLPIIAAAQGGT